MYVHTSCHSYDILLSQGKQPKSSIQVLYVAQSLVSLGSTPSSPSGPDNGYPLTPNIEWWNIESPQWLRKGKDEKCISNWSIGNLLDRDGEDFLPWQWRKSFGQILVLLCGWDFLTLCLCILPLKILPSTATSESDNGNSLSASYFKVSGLY